MSTRITHAMNSPQPGEPSHRPLYPAIYMLVGRGWSDVEIAAQLQLGVQAVAKCVQHMMDHAKMRDRLELIREASSVTAPATSVACPPR